MEKKLDVIKTIKRLSRLNFDIPRTKYFENEKRKNKRLSTKEILETIDDE